MFEKFMRANAGDFRQRYQGTFGIYSGKGVKRLVRLLTVDTENMNVHFEDRAGTRYVLNVDAEEYGFEFFTPKSCWYNTANGAYLVRRSAARQYQRGISDANTAITNQRMQAVHTDWASVSNIVENPITIKEAQAKFGVFALSDQFFVGQEKLWLFNQAIGTHKKEGDTIAVELYDPTMFQTEVNDAFRRAEIKATVK